MRAMLRRAPGSVSEGVAGEALVGLPVGRPADDARAGQAAAALDVDAHMRRAVGDQIAGEGVRELRERAGPVLPGVGRVAGPHIELGARDAVGREAQTTRAVDDRDGLVRAPDEVPALVACAVDRILDDLGAEAGR